MKKGDTLQLVIADGINFAKEGDIFTFIRKSNKYSEDKGLVLSDKDGNRHVLKEWRVALAGNAKDIAKTKKNAPRLYVVLQDSCRNFQGERAVMGLENAEELASSVVRSGEPQTVYELKAVRKVTKEPIITKA